MSEDREWIKPLVVAGIWSVVSLAIVLEYGSHLEVEMKRLERHIGEVA